MRRLYSLPRRYKSAVGWLIRKSAWFLGRRFPLSARQALVAAIGRRKPRGGFELAMGLLEDMRRSDPVKLHRFLWSNHLAYAESYEISRRFGALNINPTRHILFREMTAHLRSRGVDPRKDIRSIFEVGCSMGYLLRHLEEEIFPSATVLHGLDIDAYAVETGILHLSSLGSKVELFAADMEAVERIMGTRNFDVVLCCGVLMYVNESCAERVLRAMFSRAGHLVGLICLAPSRTEVQRSEVRKSDGAFIHNMDRMIRGVGGRLISSSWVGTKISRSSPCHVILAEPPAKTSQHGTVPRHSSGHGLITTDLETAPQTAQPTTRA